MTSFYFFHPKQSSLALHDEREESFTIVFLSSWFLLYYV